MKPYHVFLAAIGATALMAFAEPFQKLGAPWVLMGANSDRYEIGVDSEGYTRGSHAKYLRAKDGQEKGWAAMTQYFSATEYRGKRIRFSSAVRTRDVGERAGLWMRVDSSGGRTTAFYNSEDKPIRGTTDWQQRSVVLDVSEDASIIMFGVIANGKGTVLIDDLKFEIVGKDVPVNEMPKAIGLLQGPVL
jgi:hypothetical protein